MPKYLPPLALVAILLLLNNCRKENAVQEPVVSTAPADTPVADPQFHQADSLQDALQYNTVIPLYERLEVRYAEEQNWKMYITCRRKRAFCLWATRQSGAADTLCQQTLPEAEQRLGAQHLEVAKLYTVLGNVYADKRTEADFKTCLGYYHKALSICKQIYGATRSPELAGAYERLGIAYWLIDDFAEALPFYEKALSCLDSLSAANARIYLKVYNNIGLSYFNMGYSQKALEYFEKAYDLRVQVLKKKDANTMKYLVNMASAHNNMGDPDEALDDLREASAIEAEFAEPDSELKYMMLGAMGDSYLIKEDYDRVIEVYNQCLAYWRPGVRDDVNGRVLALCALGKAWLKKQQPDKALQYLEVARREADRAFGRQSFNRVGVLTPLGEAYESKGDVRKARQAFLEALDIARAVVGEHNPATGRIRKLLAELALKTGAVDEALHQAGDARLSFLTPDVPPLAEPFMTQVNSLVDMIGTQHLIGRIQVARFEADNDEVALRQSTLSFRQAIAFSDSLKTELFSKPARQAAQRQVFGIAEDGLESVCRLWQRHPAPEYLNEAFFFMEKSKAAELLASAQEIDAKHSAGIPEDWLDRETRLKTEMASYQNLLNVPEAITQLGLNFRTPIFQRRYFEAKHALDTFLVHLEQQFPEYHRLKYDCHPVALPDLRRYMADRGGQLIEYFYGKRSVYAFAVSADTVLWKKIDVAGDTTTNSAEVLDHAVAEMIHLLSDKNRQEKDPGAYFTQAWALKNSLLPDGLLRPATALVIVPDGRLSYLPFEALLTAPYQGSYAAAPWLVQQRTIQYAWSASLLVDAPTGKPRGKGMLQVTPFLAATRDGLALLPNSLREKPDNTRARLLQNKTALAATFLQQAPAFDVLHLSAHALIGRAAAPGIELYDRAITLPEIYAQHFNASLVALSACETGNGDFAKGEGVLSLARAFAYAGGRSLVASQWRVNERSTAELFAGFYQNLEQGASKAEALARAKRQLLASHEVDARKAPYYWAAFTLSGADGPVDLDTRWAWWVWALLIAAILAGVWGLQRWQNAQPKTGSEKGRRPVL